MLANYGSKCYAYVNRYEEKGPDSDAHEEETESSKKREAPRLWTLSEKTKYKRKLMIYGYGPWKQM